MSGFPGMGFSTAGGAPAAGAAPTQVGGSVALSGSVGGNGGNGGIMALLLIAGGLAVLYVGTRTIQGSR